MQPRHFAIICRRRRPIGFSEILDLQRAPDGNWIGKPGSGVGDRLFGGHALAQALMAGSLEEDGPRLAHSLHANFLKLGRADRDIRFEVTSLAVGRSFARRRVDAFQGDAHLLTMSVSSHVPEDGFSHAARAPQVVDVATARAALEDWKAQQEDFSSLPILGRLWERPIETVPLDVNSL
ncbi:MAG: acyl-CoA thioesterase domain-containing protein, partial [Alteraurantiacibacter sp.]